MATTKVEIRRGTYYDSLVLMQLQVALTSLPGVSNAGVMMGLDTNKEVLKESGLLTPEAEAALTDDLIISIEGNSDEAVGIALSKIDALLSRRRTTAQQDYRPKTLEAAAKMSPDAGWVLVSVPGEYAASVAREALRLKKHVFLYSDHVSLEDEVSLKQEAAKQGLLLMGPDCGTAIVNGIGLGFANKVRRGPIGLIGASGTGLQQVTTRIHQLDSGITHALGTGGRDLSVEVGGTSALQCLDLLRRDDETKVIVLISKPPAPEVAALLLDTARLVDKPVVVNFIGHQTSRANGDENLYFASTLDDAAQLAVKLSHSGSSPGAKGVSPVQPVRNSGYLRGLFSGGTLAYETLLILQDYLPAVYSNIPLKKELALQDVQTSQEHTILDLGEDEFTAGRPHPMLDNTLRLQRLEREARDPKVGTILLDVVLGYGAHPNPAGELAPAISRVRMQAKQAGRELEVVAVLVGTDEDPQDYESQLRQLEESGARVETSSGAAAHYVGQRLKRDASLQAPASVDLEILKQPLRAINVGLESFTESALAQGGKVIHVDWRPPAGGNVKLMTILERMKK